MKITIFRPIDTPTNGLHNFKDGIGEINDDIPNLIKSLIQSPSKLERFYVCDLNDIIEKHNRWNQLMPRIKPFYAIKCNSHPVVLELLAALDLGFDCASEIEIETILNLGVDPKRIIYAHPIKIISHIKYASSKNVTWTTFDSEAELYKCKEYYPNAEMIIRIRCDASTAMIKFGAKFGCEPYDEAPNLLKIAKELELNVIGVAFHVGTGCSDLMAFRKAIEAAKFIFDYAESLGYTFKLLDVGGGFPGNKDNCLDEFANVINPAIEHFFPDPSIRIVAEPGTYFVRSAFTLCCSIHGKKHLTSVDLKTGNNQERYMYYVPDGIFHSFSKVGYGLETIKPTLLTEKKCENLYNTTVWGQTCNGFDKIVEDENLPKAEIGDWLMFDNMGDYSISISSNFNGFLKTDVFVAANKKTTSLLINMAPHIFERDLI